MKALTDKIINQLETIKKDKEEQVSTSYLRGLGMAINMIKLAVREASFEEIAREMIKHLNDHPELYHPHHTVIIDPTRAELLEEKKSINKVFDYIKD